MPAPVRLLGLATLVPVGSLVVTLVQVIDAISGSAAGQGADEPAAISRTVADALGPVLFALLVMLPLVVFHVWHALSRTKLEGRGQRVIWIALLILLAPFSMPVYWYAHVWTPRATPGSRPGNGAP